MERDTCLTPPLLTMYPELAGTPCFLGDGPHPTHSSPVGNFTFISRAWHLFGALQCLPYSHTYLWGPSSMPVLGPSTQASSCFQAHFEDLETKLREVKSRT